VNGGEKMRKNQKHKDKSEDEGEM